MGGIELTRVSKSFRSGDGTVLAVLDEISLTIPRQAFFTIVGPSGCGKSTLLRIVADLEEPDEGNVTLPAGHRLGFVFQEPRLLEWRTVEGNLAFALDGTTIPEAEHERRIREAIETVGLSGFRNEYPRALSRGMQQRVALARAFCIEPDVLLMDEPFASVDEITARGLRADLLERWRAHDTTVLFVTHDIREAITLSDAIAVLSPKPTSVKATLDIETQRPRGPDDESTWGYHERILSLLDGDEDGTQV